MNVDDVITRFRRRVEKALPWFDPEEYQVEAERQEAVISETDAAVKRGKRTLEAYRRAHELRNGR